MFSKKLLECLIVLIKNDFDQPYQLDKMLELIKKISRKEPGISIHNKNREIPQPEDKRANNNKNWKYFYLN